MFHFDIADFTLIGMRPSVKIFTVLLYFFGIVCALSFATYGPRIVCVHDGLRCLYNRCYFESRSMTVATTIPVDRARISKAFGNMYWRAGHSAKEPSSKVFKGETAWRVAAIHWRVSSPTSSTKRKKANERWRLRSRHFRRVISDPFANARNFIFLVFFTRVFYDVFIYLFFFSF